MLDPTHAVLVSLLIPFAVPVGIIIFIVWQVRKLNRIEEAVQEILKKLNNSERKIE